MPGVKPIFAAALRERSQRSLGLRQVFEKKANFYLRVREKQLTLQPLLKTAGKADKKS